MTQDIQGRCFAAGLPIDGWQRTCQSPDGPEFLKTACRDIEAQFEAAGAALSRPQRIAAWVISLLASLAPVAIVGYTCHRAIQRFEDPRYAGSGFELIGLSLTLLLGTFLILHLLANFLTADLRFSATTNRATAVLSRTLRRIYLGPVSAYQKAVGADLTDLHAPLERIEAMVQSFGLSEPVTASPATDPPINAAVAVEQLIVTERTPSDSSTRPIEEQPAPRSAGDLFREALRRRSQ